MFNKTVPNIVARITRPDIYNEQKVDVVNGLGTGLRPDGNFN